MPRPVDVTTSAVIDRPVAEVADFSGNPSNAPQWYHNIDSVEWVTDPPMRLGSRMTFVARFLGRTLRYTYEVVEHEPGKRLVMRTADGPFPMETTYNWESVGAGAAGARGASGQATRMTLRNQGIPAGFSRFIAPFMAAAMRRANTKDLAMLKRLLESGAAT